MKIVPIKYILTAYGLSKYMLYKTIKHDPSFPVIDVGPKKNYKVDLIKFEQWLSRRALTNKQNEIPSASDLLKEFSHAR